MAKKRELLTNLDAIEELRKQINLYSSNVQEANTRLLKAQGALEVLEQLEKGVEKPNDSKSID